MSSSRSTTSRFGTGPSLIIPLPLQKANGTYLLPPPPSQDGTHVFPMKLIRGGQMNLLFPRQPKAAHFAAVLVHPLKRAEDFYRFHKQTMSQLRPVQPQISKDSPSASYRIAIQDLKKTCVHNTVRQLERSKYALPECPTPSTRDAPVVPTLAHVLTRQSPDAAESFAETSSILLEHGIRARRVVVDGYRPGGWLVCGPLATSHWTWDPLLRRWTTEDSPGADLSQAALAQYLPVMRQLFRNATFSGAKRLLIMEDKVGGTADQPLGLFFVCLFVTVYGHSPVTATGDVSLRL